MATAHPNDFPLLSLFHFEAIKGRDDGGKVSISSTFYARFLCPIFWRQKISNPKHSFVIFGAKILYKKCASKMLMKLTQGR